MSVLILVNCVKNFGGAAALLGAAYGAYLVLGGRAASSLADARAVADSLEAGASSSAAVAVAGAVTAAAPAASPAAAHASAAAPAASPAAAHASAAVALAAACPAEASASPAADTSAAAAAAAAAATAAAAAVASAQPLKRRAELAAAAALRAVVWVAELVSRAHAAATPALGSSGAAFVVGVAVCGALNLALAVVSWCIGLGALYGVWRAVGALSSADATERAACWGVVRQAALTFLAIAGLVSCCIVIVAGGSQLLSAFGGLCFIAMLLGGYGSGSRPCAAAV